MVSLWLLALVAPIFTITATPVHIEEYPEVIPGPGLPSLKSLGLTSADLHRMGFEGRNRTDWHVEKRINGCQSNNVVPQSGAVACHNYLYNIGGNTCTVSTNTIMCSSGGAAIWGSATQGGSQSVQCGYVSNSVADLLNHCTQCGGSCVQGYESCPWNTNMVVSIESPNGN